MLVSSHIYWYMDLFSKWTDTFYPSDLLRINYMFFLVPSIERQMAEGNLRLRRSAGQFVDREFIDRIFSQYSARGGTFNQIDLVQILFRLVENLWLKRE